MHDDVAAALDAAFTEREIEAVEPAGISWNERNRTVCVHFVDGEACYLKVSTAGDRTRIAREVAVVRYVGARASAPVAPVLACDPAADPPYLATAPLEGSSLAAAWDEAVRSADGRADADRTERRRLATALGRALASVHELRFEEHGRVVGGDADRLDLETAPWPDVFLDTIEDLRRFPDTDDFVDVFDDVTAAIQANRDRLDGPPAALLHGDVAKPNCVLADGEVGFVDWEMSHVGDPVRDLCRAAFHSGGFGPGEDDEWAVDAIHAGYREHVGSLPDGFEDRRPFYEALYPLLFVTHFEKMVEHLGGARRDLAAWVRAETERRLLEL